MYYTSLQRIGEPAAEPIDIAEAKRHVKQDVNDDDSLFAVYIASVRQYFEEIANIAIVTQTFELGRSEWPDYNEIRLPRPPLVAVQSVQYTLEDGTTQTLNSASYIVDTRSRPGRIIIKPYESWPWEKLQGGLPIVIRYQAGFLTPVTAIVETNQLQAFGRTFNVGTAVQLSNSGGGLPAGLSERTTYYIRDVSDATFRLAASLGGPAVAITTAGTGTHFVFTGNYPFTSIQALRLLLGHWYEHREAVIDPGRRTLLPVPLAFDSLYWQSKVF